MPAIKHILYVFCFLVFATHVSAQTDTSQKRIKIAVFAPVYLDSAFAGDAYKLGKGNIPRYVLPGLDFYNGVMLAVDSLNKESSMDHGLWTKNIEVLFYDSKSAETSLDEQTANPDLQDVSLIIASFTNRQEVKPLADLALEKKIPLISSTYPNNGGITGNPFFILLNPTLTAHIEAVYKFIRRTYPINNILVFRKKGNTEDMIQSVLNEMNKKTPGVPLKLKTVELEDNFAVNNVTDYLDSTRQNIIVCGSLSEEFGLNLTKALTSSKSYRSVAIGMPTWDGLKDIGKDLEIVYTTPYNLTLTDKLSQQLTEKYKAKYAGRPSDMMFKGFESMYHFTKLLLKYPNDFISHLSDKEYKLFNDFDIQPVKTDKEITGPDYLENKKIYIIRKVDGKVKAVN